ncbi:hypothetical protein GDO81_023763 [Engystomops pustulosus]|uniref:Uncharacterized protein n=1 Tax=Engystomops pustulosus TaxID=76066 RepID=A0AAV6YRG6_ENGPU|nr:hypothetical protein GDO81_023763 [Engystomops pustulosus]
MRGVIHGTEQLSSTKLWHHPVALLHTKYVLYRPWKKKGLKKVGDLFHETEQCWLTEQELQQKHSLTGCVSFSYHQLHNFLTGRVADVTRETAETSFSTLVGTPQSTRSNSKLYSDIKKLNAQKSTVNSGQMLVTKIPG